MERMLLSFFTLSIILSLSWIEARRVSKFKHAQCAPEWKYEGNTYNYCTIKNSVIPWCSRDKVYNSTLRNFVYCFPQACAFPFLYKGQKYSGCFLENERYWCSLTRVYRNGSPLYMFCDELTESTEESSDDCPIISGRQMEVEDTWYKDCVYYKCTKDKVITLEGSRCYNGTVCQDLESKQFPCIANGVSYMECNCTGTFDSFQMVPTIMCKVEGDTAIHRLNDQWPGPKLCQTYTCLKTGAQLDKKCNADPGCQAVGNSDFPCKIGGKSYKKCSCVAGDPDPELKTAASCTVPKDSSSPYSVGQEWSDAASCTRYRCEDEETPKVVSKKCVIDGGCQDIGASGFTCKVGNQLYKKCSCGGTEQSPELKPAPSCTVDRDSASPYSVGKEWTNTATCITYRCEDEEKTRVVTKRCSVNNECKDMGTRDFPCTVNGIDHPKCSCENVGGEPRLTPLAP